MISAVDRFVELAARPLGGNAELHLTAAGELRRRIEESAASAEALREAADSLERADRHPLRRHWRTALYLTTLLVSLPVLGYSLWQALRVVGAMDGHFGFPYAARFETNLVQSIGTGLTPQQQLLLFGNPAATDPADTWKPLWESQPDNPAFLAEYASAYFSGHKELSPEILAAAARIDADNGWFPALAAAGFAEGAVTRQSQTFQEKKEFKTPVWKINDEKKLMEALALIHQVTAKPRLTSYEGELLKQRIPLLPKRGDFLSGLPPMVYLATRTSQTIHLRKLMDALCAGAQRCAENQDAAGFKRLADDSEILARRLAESGVSIVDLLVAKTFLLGVAGNFRDAAHALGLEAEAAHFARLHELKKADRDARDQRRRDSLFDNLVRFRGSMFAGLALPMVTSQVESHPALSAADLRPGRLADHALFSRGVSILAWVALWLCAGLAFSRFRQGMLARLLSAGITGILRVSDWAWVCAGGILIPVSYYLAITRLTPLSAREWSLGATALIQPSCQFGALAVLLILFPVMIATWRLAKRGAPLGLATPMSWTGWLAAVSAALAIPVFGGILSGWQPVGYGRSHPMILNFGFVLLGIAVLWLLVGFSRNVLGRPHHALRRAVLARMVLPAWVFGMLVMAVAVPLHHAEERHWIARDRLLEISADAPALSRYEWAVAQVLRKELLALMD